VALIAIFAMLFQAVLFGWHHHDRFFAAHGAPASLGAADNCPRTSPAVDAEGCEICVALHHQAAAPAAFGALPAAVPASASLSPAETAIVGLSSPRAFDSRAPPRA